MQGVKCNSICALMRFRHTHLSSGLLFFSTKSVLLREYSGKTWRVWLLSFEKVKVVVCLMSDSEKKKYMFFKKEARSFQDIT